MKLWPHLIILAVLFSIVSGCQKTITAPAEHPGDPLLDTAAKVQVGRVIDGDTFVIGIGKDSFSVRIIGIDAFEVRHDARLDSQALVAHISVDSAYALGTMAKRFADSLLSKQTVLLVRDNSQPDFDTYNRLLRYVYYYQGTTAYNFGEIMLQKRLALIDTL